MQRTQLINELKLLRKRHQNDKYATFETRWIDVLDAVIAEFEESGWHTGTPTKDGYYLVQLRGYDLKDTIGKIVAKWERNWWRTIHVGSYWNLEEDIKAWMPIEPYKETD